MERADWITGWKPVPHLFDGLRRRARLAALIEPVSLHKEGSTMTMIHMSLVCLALGAAPKVASELLPETPEGWRFERIDFPLPFAPDLKYTGFEELRFAPGMFDAKSDTYFTYVFAMRITNEFKVSAVDLKSFLETYFRGLCRMVSKDTNFKIDPSKISAVVQEDHFEAQRARHFRITLSSFDPFVTGKPLMLNLEILVVKMSPTDHRIFAAISPQPTGASIWKLLRKLKRQFHKNTIKNGK